MLAEGVDSNFQEHQIYREMRIEQKFEYQHKEDINDVENCSRSRFSVQYDMTICNSITDFIFHGIEAVWE